MDFATLIQQPESLRDDQWEDDFLTQFTARDVQLESEQAKPGPDGWPYLHVRTGSEVGAAAPEPVAKVLEWLAGRGIGMVVNAHKMMPDYVFTYGMVWNYIATGRFVQPVASVPRAHEVVYHEGDQLLKGAPSDEYLPPYVRSVLKQFLAAQGFSEARVLVISTADFQAVDLIFSLASLGSLPASEHKTVAAMIAWFLPLHYSLVLGDERGLPPFHPL